MKLQILRRIAKIVSFTRRLRQALSVAVVPCSKVPLLPADIVTPGLRKWDNHNFSLLLYKKAGLCMQTGFFCGLKPIRF
jgi:hypothetical protein